MVLPQTKSLSLELDSLNTEHTEAQSLHGALVRAGAPGGEASDPIRPMATALLDPGLTSALPQWPTLGHPPLHTMLLATPC